MKLPIKHVSEKWQKSNFRTSKERLAAQTHTAIHQASTEKAALTIANAHFKAERLSPPKGKHLQGTLLRMVDPDVWERKLKQRNRQQAEKSIRDKGRIFKHGEVYASDYTVKHFIEMQKDSKAFLKRQQLISNEGDEISLATIAASTVANPSHRRNEMMTRMRGTEEVAKQKGLMCLFITFTAASIFHPKRFIKAQDTFINNPQYKTVLALKNKQGVIEQKPNTPKEAHAFIKRIVNRSIAKFKRQDIDYMGYKVVEPHHDGTPHWHMAFFVTPEQKQLATAIFTHYALQEFGDEKGAKQHRIIIKNHDPKQGSVTGYMAKYISKGISGLDVGEDYETGLDAEDSTVRLLAWKSLWGIRQFGFFGSPSVTVWRELRRLREPLANSTLEQARLSADKGDWDQFIHIMKQHEITINNQAIEDEKGQFKYNKYKEVIERIMGLKITGLSGVELIRTRFKEWFLVDLEKLEKRIIKGLPFQHRHNSDYLAQIQGLLNKAIENKKLCYLYEKLGGVVPFSAMATGTISAALPLGLVRNNVTVLNEGKN